MRTIDIGAYFVVYNLVIGVLVMLSSEKLGYYAGLLNKAHRERLARFTRLTAFTFGASVAALAATIYIAFFTLRIGV